MEKEYKLFQRLEATDIQQIRVEEAVQVLLYFVFRVITSILLYFFCVSFVFLFFCISFVFLFFCISFVFCIPCHYFYFLKLHMFDWIWPSITFLIAVLGGVLRGDFRQQRDLPGVNRGVRRRFHRQSGGTPQKGLQLIDKQINAQSFEDALAGLTFQKYGSE